ncbi:adenine phosphoribosyltransferase [Thalassoporum mexicanum PCC 7367]|uniref:adenine phosphoribosyltransferase n=1 Tax=Thalassoporum mexicanum TaxID=3457544 RepID=UPI00029FDA06|nr:adenine phosphoribosyltransferase [Pseudanabaena sp. PCC 7367]AFY69040.1 adenine phosphoribosyltransferase [Pseudanabaena sp. PCC 7367]
MDLKAYIRDIPDFPKPGIVFRDITPVLAHPQGLPTVAKEIAAAFADQAIDYVVGIESRGFIIGTVVSHAIGCGFVPVRKPGKLPAAVHRVEYELEYGTDKLEVHQDAIAQGSRILIVDDIIATGGTAAATAKLVNLAGGELVGYGFMVELLALQGRQALPDVNVFSLITY